MGDGTVIWEMGQLYGRCGSYMREKGQLFGRWDSCMRYGIVIWTIS